MVDRRSLKAFTRVLYYLHRLREQDRGPFKFVHASKVCMVMRVNYDSGREALDALERMGLTSTYPSEYEHLRLSSSFDGSPLHSYVLARRTIEYYGLDGFDDSQIVATVFVDEMNEPHIYEEECVEPSDLPELSIEEYRRYLEILSDGAHCEDDRRLIRRIQDYQSDRLARINEEADD